MARIKIQFLAVILSCSICEGFMFAGLHATLDKSQVLASPGSRPVSGWVAVDSASKPGLFMKDISLDAKKSTLSISSPGIYYLSYNLRLNTKHKGHFQGGVAIDSNSNTGLAFQSHLEPLGPNLDVSGAGFIKLTEFNSISVTLNITSSIGVDAVLQTGSSLSIALVTVARVIPSFSFSLSKDTSLKPYAWNELRHWSEDKTGQFHSTVGLLPGRSFIQAICEGIYLISANIIVHANRASSLRMQLRVDHFTVQEINETFINQTIKTINVYKIIHLKKAEAVSLRLETDTSQIEVKQESSWSASLLNTVSKHTIGFNTNLLQNFMVNKTASYTAITGWPVAFDKKTEFKSPTVFTNLVNGNQDFNPSSRAVFLVTTNVILSCRSLIGNRVSIAIYSRASRFSITEKSISGVSNQFCSTSKSVSVSLTAAVDLLKTESISVSIKTESGSAIILPGTSFSVCQLAIYYPGMLGRLTAAARYSTIGWQTLKNWKTDEIKGNYDLLQALNETTGKYKIPVNGLYLVAANIIVMDLSEVETLISLNSKINIGNGMYAKVGNPTDVMTVNMAGIMQLKRGDDVSVMVHSPSDTDWSVKENGGFSVAYVGQNSHCFQAYLPASIVVSKKDWTATSSWQTLFLYGTAFTQDTGQFKVQVSGVYYTAATLILENADAIDKSSYFQMAIRINGLQVDSLISHRSGPKNSPVRRRYYPLFLSGSFRASAGDVITLEVFSSYDVSYNILENSGWSMFLVAADGNTEQIGFGLSKSTLKTFPRTSAGAWYTILQWATNVMTTGSFYKSSKISFDDGIEATIRSTGFYAISANIKIEYGSSSSVFKLGLFIQDELQQNGLTYENIRAWTTFTMHFTGVAFLIEGQTVKLKVTSVAIFDDAVIHKDSGLSITRLQIAENYPAVSLVVKKPYNVPVALNSPINSWSTENSAASFSFTSGRRYNKTSGIFNIRDAGYYLVSMNVILQSNSSDSTNMTVTIQAGRNRDIYSLLIGNRSTLAISSTVFQSRQVGDAISITTNITGNGNSSLNSTSLSKSSISILEGSSFSVVKFPLSSTNPSNHAVYLESTSYSSPGQHQLSGWSVPPLTTKSEALFVSDKDGIFSISMNMKLLHFIGSASFSFISNRGTLATSKVYCELPCQEYITLNNFVRLQIGDTVSTNLILGSNSYLTIEATSHRTITFVRDYKSAVGVSVRTNNSSKLPNTGGFWKRASGYAVQDGLHGTFDARGNFSMVESMIIPITGAYQVVVNLNMAFNSSVEGQGTVEVGVSKNGAISQSSTLYTKRNFIDGKSFTLHIMSSVIIPKWTKINLMIKTNRDFVLQQGSTISVVFIDSIVNEMCKDDGPRMGDQLSPAWVATGVTGKKRNWTCSAVGNEIPTYKWFKDGQVVNNTRMLEIEGNLADTGKYYCEADINGIIAQSNEIHVQIYDVDECYYRNHSCHAQATCTNTAGSYNCTCNKGYAGNGTTCIDINECNRGLHDCANYSKCHNLPGSFSCRCPLGFFGDGKIFCKDLDECLLPVLNNCSKNALCSNTIGSYDCSCSRGWSGNGRRCIDVDECMQGTHSCDKNAFCTNLNGTYGCTCQKGFVGNGFAGNCTDLNECLFLPKTTPSVQVTAHPNATVGPKVLYCSANAACVNSAGEYGCQCNAGFTGNGTHCYDINECDGGQKNVKCAQLTAECFNTPGSYSCVCRAGYTGDGTDCRDIDECVLQTHQCDPLANCTNDYGSYSCSCPKGYYGNGKTCTKASSTLELSNDPCITDKTSLKCICKDSKGREKNILCNGLFVAIIILSVVAIIVIMFGVKYIKSRKNIKIGPVKTAKDKYIEMEDESEV